MKRTIIIGALAPLAVPAFVHLTLEGISRYVNETPPAIDEASLELAPVELLDHHEGTVSMFWYSFGLTEYVSLGTATLAVYILAVAIRIWLLRRSARKD
ncbi:hypothetical protein [Paenibacillus methanolicus]|uniref:Uncharacterized protein n=1 Tax=Paenibacillus methanolicus TaxID=582686 RepID=A0A5S5BVS4_9BACL|nr:hypothetical protein [Paenibacillus methanolicus]TYP69703.1 hypothetical protein BCM02_11332 [Paenibacillus methanolicus]